MQENDDPARSLAGPGIKPFTFALPDRAGFPNQLKSLIFIPSNRAVLI